MSIQETPKQRLIQEYVPGKQITLAHVIASPIPDICVKLGLDDGDRSALGIINFTPPEGVIIAADIATKSGNVSIGFLDRFGGSLLIQGDVASVETALQSVLNYFSTVLKYTTAQMTRT